MRYWTVWYMYHFSALLCTRVTNFQKWSILYTRVTFMASLWSFLLGNRYICGLLSVGLYVCESMPVIICRFCTLKLYVTISPQKTICTTAIAYHWLRNERVNIRKYRLATQSICDAEIWFQSRRAALLRRRASIASELEYRILGIIERWRREWEVASNEERWFILLVTGAAQRKCGQYQRDSGMSEIGRWSDAIRRYWRSHAQQMCPGAHQPGTSTRLPGQWLLSSTVTSWVLMGYGGTGVQPGFYFGVGPWVWDWGF